MPYDVGMTTTGRRAAKRSEARERLLSTASQLFYSEGIAGVGVDRIVSEGHVTLATFYRHFPSKEDLVISYLEGVHEAIAEQITAATTQAEGPEDVRALGAQVVSELGQKGFRGCAFITPPRSTRTPTVRSDGSLPAIATGTTTRFGGRSTMPDTHIRATPRATS